MGSRRDYPVPSRGPQTPVTSRGRLEHWAKLHRSYLESDRPRSRGLGVHPPRGIHPINTEILSLVNMKNPIEPFLDTKYLQLGN